MWCLQASQTVSQGEHVLQISGTDGASQQGAQMTQIKGVRPLANTDWNSQICYFNNMKPHEHYSFENIF